MKKTLVVLLTLLFCLAFSLPAFAEPAGQSADLASINARLAKLEAKSKLTFFFDNRIEGTWTSLDETDPGMVGGGTVNGKTQFMERIRMYISSPVGDQWRWDARLVQAKWNFEATAAESPRFDRFWVTGKDILGGQVEIGKMMLYPGKGCFYGNTGDTEGIYYTKNIDKLTLRIGDAQAGGQEVSFVEATYRPTKTADIGVYTLQHKLNATTADIDLRVVNGAVELSKGLALSAEYAKNYADGAAYDGKTGYFVAIQSKYKATNYMPALYTSMVNPFVKGDHGCGLSYRRLEDGVAGSGNRGAFNWVPLTQDRTGKWQNTYDDVKAIRLDYVYVPWKNVQWTLTYDNVKPLNGNWTNNSIQSTFNFFF